MCTDSVRMVGGWLNMWDGGNDAFALGQKCSKSLIVESPIDLPVRHSMRTSPGAWLRMTSMFRQTFLACFDGGLWALCILWEKQSWISCTVAWESTSNKHCV